MADEEKKIIIDEGWKDQVEREKKDALNAAARGPEEEGVDDQNVDACFEALVGGLAGQAMLSLGLLAPEGVDEVVVSLDEAKHVIDTLIMLHGKTKGNLTDHENEGLAGTIGELERAYAVRSQQVMETSMGAAGPPEQSC